jgi:hypothetical protein
MEKPMRPLARQDSLFLSFLLTALLTVAATPTWGAESSEYRFDKGDRNFPQENAHARQTFVLKGTADPALDLVFYTTWTVFSSEPDCETGHQGRFVAIPLAVSWNGAHFSGVVAIDGMLPGHCNWRFSDVRAAPRGEVVNLGYAFGGRTIVQTNSPPLPQGSSPNLSRHLQCGVFTSSGPGRKLLSCDPLFPPAWWYPATTEIEFEFRLRP